MSGRAVLGVVVGLAATFAIGLLAGRATVRAPGSPEAVAASASGAAPAGGDKPAEEEKESKPKVRTAGVDRSVVSQRLVCFGSARGRPGTEVLVTARAAAVVAEVLVRSGDKVEAGQALVRLDARPFTAALRKAEGALAEAQAELQKATRGALAIELQGLEVALEQARADSLQADRSLFRQTQLQTSGLVSEKQLQEAEAAAKVARLRLQAAEQQLERAKGGLQAEERIRLEARVAQAQADVDAAKLQESLCELKAPLAGVVSELDVVAGQAVDATTPVARVAAPSVVDAVLSVPAERAGKVALGADVRLVAGGSELARARVAGIAAAATPDGFVRVRAEVVDPTLVQRVLAGTPLAGEIALGQLEALTVPSSAVVQDHDRTVIVIVEKVHEKTPDGKDDEKDLARKVAVKVLVRDGLVVAVEGPAPLAQHAHVVIEGAYNLPDGVEVDVDD